MTRLITLVSCFLFTVNYYSQTTLWGVASAGGQYSIGTIFKTDGSCDNFSKVHDFFRYEGQIPGSTKLVQALDGKLYGMTWSGGQYNSGVLFQYDPATNIYIKKIDFDGPINGGNPNGSLLLAADGKLYGMTCLGGIHNGGIIFQYDPTANIFTKKFEFDATITGSSPKGDLIQTADGKLYGLTSYGGANYMGTLFQYDLVSNSFIKKIDFSGASNGTSPQGSLIEASDGNLYGLTNSGGTNDLGVIFQYNPITELCSKKIDFNGLTNGSYPDGSLIQATNGKLYGLTKTGGASSLGVIFEYDISSYLYTKKIDFTGTANGSMPYASLMQATDGNLYGMTDQGGATNKGALFQYNPTTNICVKKIDFAIGTNGFNSRGSLMQATDGKIYGMTIHGGSNSSGVIFQYNPTTNSYTKKIDFNGSNGQNPYSSLVQANDGAIYGTTQSGGTNAFGVLFKYNSITANYTKLYDFDGTSGSYPYGALIQATNAKLYGMTYTGGLNNKGTLFAFDLQTLVYNKLFDFDGNLNGSNPQGSLMQASNGKLYGMTSNGGTNNKGTLFQFDITNSTFTKLIDFDETTNGMVPNGTLMQAADGKLYGLTLQGGLNGGPGTLFQYDISTNTLVTKFNFDGAFVGSNPIGALVETTNGILYGLTSGGGVNFAGALFEYDYINNTISKKLDFGSPLSATSPQGSLLKASNGMLYGTTWGGGANSWGTLFQYNPTTDTYLNKFDFDMTNGANPASNLIEVISAVDIKENEANRAFTCFPNPNNGSFKINTSRKAKIVISNTLGKPIISQIINEGKHDIQLNNISNGIYFIQVMYDDKYTITEKLIINR